LLPNFQGNNLSTLFEILKTIFPPQPLVKNVHLPEPNLISLLNGRNMLKSFFVFKEKPFGVEGLLIYFLNISSSTLISFKICFNNIGEISLFL
jgi:hypothetical protein